MFRLFLLVLALGIATPAVAGDRFCDGYQAGYKAGVCHGNALCLPPLPPLCPLPNLGDEGFQDGYNRGFVDGMADRR